MPPLLKVQNLIKTFEKKKLSGQREEVRALDGVSFSLSPGRTLAILGESGSGKSTLAFCLACLERPTSGNILFEEADLVRMPDKELRTFRRKIQLIFQDSANSLNPRWSVGQILAEPMLLQSKLRRDEVTRRASSLLEQVGLSPDMEKRAPGELSGGQRQRLAIARALTVEPRLLILDEALSALDCSVQAQIVNLLVELQMSLGMAYLFISHDLVMAAHLADEIAVMSCGRIVEQGSPGNILKNPSSEITRKLVAATPRLSIPPQLPLER